MRIGLIGKGKMGKAVAEVVRQSPHQITQQFDSGNPPRPEALQQIDVVIDFSTASAMRQHVEAALKGGCPLVSGTTGWEADFDAIKQLVKAQDGSFLYAANFSIGVLLFQKLARYAGQLFAPFSNYDVAIHEIHHREKIDSPSGTARMLAESLLQELPEKDTLLFGNPEAKISRQALQISSSRVGGVPGTHSIYIDSAVDHIQLTHTARGRLGFAEGALKAAEWLVGKKGFYSIQDMLEDYRVEH